jgi:hypothetical protein
MDMSLTLQIVGVVAITVGALIVSVPVGLIVGGVFLTVIGIALGR